MNYKFKRGDRVRATTDFGRVKKGFTGTVLNRHPMPYVAWDNEEVVGPENFGYRNVWAVHEDDLELLDANQYAQER